MSVVIIGGHDRMVEQYKTICREHKCKAKVFTQMSANLSKKIGCPDLLVYIISLVSAAASVGTEQMSTGHLVPLYFPLSEFVNTCLLYTSRCV